MQAEWGRKDAAHEAGDASDATDLLYWDDIHPYGPTGHRCGCYACLHSVAPIAPSSAAPGCAC